jgi:predicted dehydrogenase
MAMIGLGLRANLLDVAHRPGRGSRVVAVCDLDASRARRHAARLDATVRATTDAAELLGWDDVDAVIVATPDNTHEELVIAALNAGKATFAEKPLAITTASCDRILGRAMQTGTQLYVGHNMRHFAMVRQMKQLIDDGAIGEVRAIWCRHFVGHGGDFYFKDWHAQRRNVTSLLLQKGAHDIDVIHWLAGSTSQVVSGFGRLAVYGDVEDRHDGHKHADWFAPDTHWPPRAQRGLHPEIDVEDLSMINMVMRNGVIASYNECHFTPDYWRNYTVIGTEGRIENFGDTEGVVRLWNRRGGYSPTGDLEFPFHSSEGGHGGADLRLMQEFVRFVREGGSTDTSPVGARDAVATGCAGAESLRKGGAPVTVVPVPADVEDWFARGQRA